MSGASKDTNFEDHIAVLAARVAKRIERHVDRHLRQALNIGVHEWRLLVHVYNFRNQRISDIATALNFSPEKTIALFGSLSEKHFVRIAETADGKTVAPTDVGKGIYEAILPYWLAYQRRIVAGLTSEEQDSMRAGLSKMIAHLDRMAQRD